MTRRIYKLAGAAGLLASGLFLLGGIGLLQARLQPGIAGGTGILDNWLLVLLQLNAGFSGIGFDALTGLNPLDLVLLFLMGLLCFGLYVALKSTSRIGSLIALVQPFLGILILCVTQSAGRSALMGAMLVISLVMLRSILFSKPVAFTGLAAASSF